MAEIDRKLERLMGQEEYNAILNAPSSITFDTVCRKNRVKNMARVVLFPAWSTQLLNHW